MNGDEYIHRPTLNSTVIKMADRLRYVSMYAGIDGAVMEERRRGRELLSEAQASLEVARREQTKTALQLQRSQRKVCVRKLIIIPSLAERPYFSLSLSLSLSARTRTT